MGSVTAAWRLSGYIIDEAKCEGRVPVLQVHAKRRAKPYCKRCGHAKSWRHGSPRGFEHFLAAQLEVTLAKLQSWPGSSRSRTTWRPAGQPARLKP